MKILQLSLSIRNSISIKPQNLYKKKKNKGTITDLGAKFVLLRKKKSLQNFLIHWDNGSRMWAVKSNSVLIHSTEYSDPKLIQSLSLDPNRSIRRQALLTKVINQ